MIPERTTYERYLDKKLFLRALFYCVLLVAMVAAILSGGYYAFASGETANPTNAPGFPGNTPIALGTGSGGLWYAAWTPGESHGNKTTCFIGRSDNSPITNVTTSNCTSGFGTDCRNVNLSPRFCYGTDFAPGAWLNCATGSCPNGGTQIKNLGTGSGGLDSDVYTKNQLSLFSPYVLLQVPNWVPTATLTNLTPGSVTAGQRLTLHAHWTDTTTAPQYLFFYPSGRAAGNCGVTVHCPTNVVNLAVGTPLQYSHGSGSLDFNYTYNFAATYSGTILVSTDCGQFGLNTNYNSCNVARAVLHLTQSGNPDLDTRYNVKLDFPATGNARIVGEEQAFGWRVDPSLCSGSTISTNTLFSGYPGALGSNDPGTTLTGNSGSGNYVFHYASSDYGSPKPYIQYYCADGRNGKIYYPAQAGYGVHGTLYATRAGSLLIETAETLQYWAGTYLNGGNSSDWNGSGSGAQFFTDKKQYSRGEQVRTQFTYNVTFPVGSLQISPDPNQLSDSFSVSTGTLLQTGYPHNFKFSYAAEGTYYPRIRVKSTSYNPSDPTTYRDIWLGGSQIRDQGTYVLVTTAIFGALPVVPGVLDGSGNGIGIFGLPSSAIQISFPVTNNPFLQFVQDAVNQAISALWYIVSLIFSIAEQAPPLNMIKDIIAPSPGTIFTYPAEVMVGVPNPFAGQQVTIAYPSEAQAGAISLIAKMFIVAGLAMDIIAHLMFHGRDDV